MATVHRELADFVSQALSKAARPKIAGEMAAYMKTDMPFYGVQKKARADIYRALRKQFALTTNTQYRGAVSALWKRAHREEKYMALMVARGNRDFIGLQNMDLYEKLIREGAWWDLVDEVAINLVGPCLLENRKELAPVMDAWLEDDDMWIRRSAIISHIKHKEKTDHRRLFRYCKARAHETEFFIRKGIGWALRDYSYAEPERVAKFLRAHRDKLSGLSFREAKKVMERRGQWSEDD